MSTTVVTPYQMNPAEDRVVYADELTEGMWVMFEDPAGRCSSIASEDVQIRMNRFCRVTRLREVPGQPCVAFIGEWVDGYQKRLVSNRTGSWIVKREGIPTPEAELLDDSGEEESPS